MTRSASQEADEDCGATTLSVAPAMPGSPFGPGGAGFPLLPDISLLAFDVLGAVRAADEGATND
jgi:hypothetical protein